MIETCQRFLFSISSTILILAFQNVSRFPLLTDEIFISQKVFPMDKHDVRYAFDETVKRAGLKNIRLHDLRKTFSTRLDEMGVPLNLIKALLGHSTNDVTETHYIDRMVETLRPHILLLDEYYEKYGISLEEIMRKAG